MGEIEHHTRHKFCYIVCLLSLRCQCAGVVVVVVVVGWWFDGCTAAAACSTACCMLRGIVKTPSRIVVARYVLSLRCG
jgi:hypothetical protein